MKAGCGLTVGKIRKKVMIEGNEDCCPASMDCLQGSKVLNILKRLKEDNFYILPEMQKPIFIVEI